MEIHKKLENFSHLKSGISFQGTWEKQKINNDYNELGQTRYTILNEKTQVKVSK